MIEIAFTPSMLVPTSADKGPLGALAGLQQAYEATPQPPGLPRGLHGSCAHCGGPAVRTSTGKLHKSGRYCSRACKAEATAERRRQARADLLDALGEFERVRQRVESALQVLGLNPTRRRSR
jgi:hypothetical protein